MRNATGSGFCGIDLPSIQTSTNGSHVSLHPEESDVEPPVDHPVGVDKLHGHIFPEPARGRAHPWAARRPSRWGGGHSLVTREVRGEQVAAAVRPAAEAKPVPNKRSLHMRKGSKGRMRHDW
jgi:hypothetical protein